MYRREREVGACPKSCEAAVVTGTDVNCPGVYKNSIPRGRCIARLMIATKVEYGREEV